MYHYSQKTRLWLLARTSLGKLTFFGKDKRSKSVPKRRIIRGIAAAACDTPIIKPKKRFNHLKGLQQHYLSKPWTRSHLQCNNAYRRDENDLGHYDRKKFGSSISGQRTVEKWGAYRVLLSLRGKGKLLFRDHIDWGNYLNSFIYTNKNSLERSIESLRGLSYNLEGPIESWKVHVQTFLTSQNVAKQCFNARFSRFFFWLNYWS